MVNRKLGSCGVKDNKGGISVSQKEKGCYLMPNFSLSPTIWVLCKHGPSWGEGKK